jgi:midasin (ATPase involved in ribosome maturation)
LVKFIRLENVKIIPNTDAKDFENSGMSEEMKEKLT